MSSHEEYLSDLQELYSDLQAEIDFLLEDLPAGKDGYPDLSALSAIERRIVVRSVFSFIEAATFKMKTNALLWDSAALSPQEIALINEEDYELDDTGAIRTRRARLRFFGNIRFAFAVAAKAAGVDYQLVVGGSGWQALRESVTVRDRLMHPKKATDLVVTDADIQNAMDAFRWIMDEMGRLAAEFLLRRWSAADS